MSGKAARFFLTLIAGCFILGLWALFSLRFEVGDVFPPYSSLRSDPMGAMVFYRSLERISSVAVRRHFRDLSRLEADRKATVFYLGARADFLTAGPPGAAERMESLASRGARLVISFVPGRVKASRGADEKSCRGFEEDDSEKGSGPESSPWNKEPPADQNSPEAQDPASLKWDIKPAESTTTSAPPPLWAFSENPANGLPSRIPVRSSLYFDSPGPAWKILYSVEKRPVLVERTFGEGSIVLVADSYLFSNEAMREACFPVLLARLIGESRELIFDENHLGVEEDPSYMGLARKYRLQGLIGVLILLACLFLWQNLYPFIPARVKTGIDEEDEAGEGKDQLSGLINLLRRNIALENINKVCFDAWLKSRRRGGLEQDEQKVVQVRELLESCRGRSARSGDAVENYRKISEILSEQ